MLPTTTVTAVSHAQPWPRARSIGAVLLVTAVFLAPGFATSSLADACDRAPLLGTPAGPVLGLMIAVAGAALLFGVPRTSAVAPAFALGAGVPLLGGAIGGWLWQLGQPCAGSVLDAPAGLLVLQGGAAIAVIAVSGWLLYSRDEFEPWGGVGGVATSATAAVFTLLIGVGLAVLVARPAGFSAVVISVAIALPWAMNIGATGWLRQSPALASVASIGVQAVWLLVLMG